MSDSLLSSDLALAAQRELVSGRCLNARALTDELFATSAGTAGEFHLRGLIEIRDGEFARAAEWFERALAMDPTRLVWRNHLAMARAGEGDWRGSADIFESVLSLAPENPTALHGLGRALLELEDGPAAIPYLMKSLGAQPDNAATLTILARALAKVGDFKEAADLLRRALKLNAEQEEPCRILGRISATCAKYHLARSCWETVLRLVPDDIEALAGLVKAHWELGDLQDTLALSARLIADGRATLGLHCFWLYSRLYDPAETPLTIRHSCEEFGRKISPAQPAVFKPGAVDRIERPLRIGYLSGEFKFGAAYYFLAPLVANHDKSRFEVFLYHTFDLSDPRTHWFQHAGHWRSCHSMDDEALRELLRRDEIDILVDLSGFLPNNRLTLFAARAAPVQVTFPNCPVTTGVPAIDYILTDRWTCPPGHEAQYTERPVFLPGGYLSYVSHETAPEISRLPALANGYLTFGLFQRRAKMNSRVWDLVAEVLRQCPNSRLLVQNNDPMLDSPDSESHLELVREFASRGVPSERLTLWGKRCQTETMECMAMADIALDTFPYQGQTTTCECLWVGVPVVARSGDLHVARVGSAILEQAGLGHLAADTDSEYVERALDLATDLDGLARLRTGLRDRLRTSTLSDGRRLAREVEEAYLSMWTAWREGRTLGPAYE
jgi:predicted O-linked N-acetylglucosamine transferase (SPINDLY family)